jgi:DNA-directed RNA polymerase subunit M/transcription elongation factor TFIIS
MAEIVCDRACSSSILVNSKRDNEVSTCKMCKNYEKLLNEALDELNSVQTIKRLLQKELLTYTAHMSTWGIELHPTKKNSDPDACIEWTLVNTTNRMAK